MAGKGVIAHISDYMSRIRLANMVGKQFGGDRDLYEVLGYKRVLRPLDFIEMYYREDIAYRIVNSYPAATWRVAPKITEDETEDDTEFESAVEDLADQSKLWHYCERADKLCGLGRYSILILGVDDGAQLAEPLTRAVDINWLMPVTEQWAEVATWGSDPISPQFGKPETYRVTIGSEEDSTQPRRTVIVHHTRVIHIAEHTGQDDVYGVPRLEPVYNRIYDLQKVVGGSAEVFWMNARNGLVFEADEGAQLTPDDVDQLQEDAADYQHQLRRLLTSKGGKWRVLESSTPDPKSNVEVILQLIAGATGIPNRILVGSERGELSSAQDENNWLGRISERRVNFAEPVIIRPLIDRLIDLGILPQPRTGTYLVEWTAADGLSDKERAEIGNMKAQALAQYVNSLGADSLVTGEEFREHFLHMEPQPAGGLPGELPDLFDDEPGADV